MNNLVITEGTMRTFVNQLGILEIAIAALADDVELHMVANRDNGTESVAYDLINGLPLLAEKVGYVKDQLAWTADEVRKLSENEEEKIEMIRTTNND